MTDDPLFQQLMQIFREEAIEGIDRLFALVTEMRGAQGRARIEVADAAMRVAHTLKGASSAVGFDLMSRVAHALEDALELGRDEPERLSDALLTDCEEAVSVLSRLLGGDSPNSVEPLLARLGGGSVSTTSEGAVNSAEEPPVEASLPTVDEPRELESHDPKASSREQGDLPSEAHEPNQRRMVRVEASKLDAILGQVAELVTTETALSGELARIDELYEQLTESGQRPEIVEQLGRELAAHHRSLRRLSNLGRELGERVRRLRLLPLRVLEMQFRRTVADAGRLLGREVSLVLETPELELDKGILDQLGEPLLHLLRNAVDHGIEPPEERRRTGKSLPATIAVSARVTQSTVVVEVSDDGRGIDVGMLGESLRQKGTLTSEQISLLGEAEILDCIFEPGFSTARVITNVSGRGVGLDVVRRCVHEMRGSVEVVPKGKLGGATFRLTLPLDVLSSQVLFVRSGASEYALPLDGVLRTLRIPRSRLAFHDGMAVLLHVLDDDTKPLRIEALSLLLGEPERETSGDLAVVVVARGGKQLGLIVDEVLGTQDVVVKRLPWNFRRVAFVTGGCIMSSGSVALALDIGILSKTTPTRMAAPAPAMPSRSRRVLVVDDSHTARALSRNALASAGYEVELAVNGLRAWERLQLDPPFGLVVSDIQMPELDGFELTQRVRAHPKLARLPVILVTTRSTREDVERGVAVGADEYIIKGPLQQQLLLEAVARHL